MNYTLINFLLMTAVLLPALAQPPEPTPEMEEPSIPPYNLSVRFYTWPLKGILHGDMNVPTLESTYLGGSSGLQPVRLARASLSPALKYQGMEAPVLITPKQANTSGRNGSPQWIRTVIATPEIRREWSQAVVILFPESKRPDGTWSSISIPVSNLEVPEGENLFLNATTSGLVLEIDGKRKLMPPGQKQTLKSVTNKGRIRVRLYAKDQKGEVRLLYTGSHWNRAEKGNLYLIYSQNQDRFRVLKMNVEDFSASTSQP